jgi:hypothetical protein
LEDNEGRLSALPEYMALDGRLSSLHYLAPHEIYQKTVERAVQASQAKASALS